MKIFFLLLALLFCCGHVGGTRVDISNVDPDVFFLEPPVAVPSHVGAASLDSHNKKKHRLNQRRYFKSGQVHHSEDFHYDTNSGIFHYHFSEFELSAPLHNLLPRRENIKYVECDGLSSSIQISTNSRKLATSLMEGDIVSLSPEWGSSCQTYAKRGIAFFKLTQKPRVMQQGRRSFLFSSSFRTLNPQELFHHAEFRGFQENLRNPITNQDLDAHYKEDDDDDNDEEEEGEGNEKKISSKKEKLSDFRKRNVPLHIQQEISAIQARERGEVLGEVLGEAVGEGEGEGLQDQSFQLEKRGLGKKLKKGFKKAKKGVKKGVGKVKKGVKKGVDKVKKGAKKAKKGVKKGVNKVKNGVKKGINKVKNGVKDVATKAINGVKNFVASKLNGKISKRFKAELRVSMSKKVGPLTLSGQLTFSVNVAFTLVIKSLKLSSFQIELIGTAGGTVGVTVSAAKAKNWNFSLVPKGSVPITIPTPVPGLFVKVEPYLKVDASVNAQLSASATASVSATGQVGAKLQWQSKSWKVSPITSISFNVQKPQITDLEASVTLNLVPKVGLNIGASALGLLDLKGGPEISIQLSVGFRSSLSCPLELKWGWKVGLGIQLNLSIVGKSLLGKGFTKNLGKPQEKSKCLIAKKAKEETTEESTEENTEENTEGNTEGER